MGCVLHVKCVALCLVYMIKVMQTQWFNYLHTRLTALFRDYPSELVLER